jgi:hypothetical protein
MATLSEMVDRMKVDTFRGDHPEIGSSVTRHISIGRLHLSLEFCRGVYGFRHTRSYGFRVWVA